MKAVIPEINLEECTGCGDCVEKCPVAAVGLVNDKATIISPEDCSYCIDCETICPAGAIRCPFEIILVTTQPRSDSEEPQARLQAKNPNSGEAL